MHAVNVRIALGILITAVAWSLGLAPSTAAAEDDPRVGTWELNLAKSTFNPGPPPRKQTLTFKAVEGGLTAILQGIDHDGKPLGFDAGNLAINFDGKDHPTPNADYDSSAWKRAGAKKYEVARKRAGKIVQTSVNIISSDGKTMTITTKGVAADGRAIDNVRVYDKQ